jgi:hypothetical protein
VKYKNSGLELFAMSGPGIYKGIARFLQVYRFLIR